MEGVKLSTGRASRDVPKAVSGRSSRLDITVRHKGAGPLIVRHIKRWHYKLQSDSQIPTPRVEWILHHGCCASKFMVSTKSRNPGADLRPGAAHPHWNTSEVLLAPHEVEARLGVHIAFNVELAAECFRPTEEDPSLGGRMDLAKRTEDGVPIGSAKARG